MEGQDQYQAACMNRKGLTDFKCPKKLIEQKVRVYISPTVAQIFKESVSSQSAVFYQSVSLVIIPLEPKILCLVITSRQILKGAILRQLSPEVPVSLA